MVKNRVKFYTVWIGKKTGVFDTWKECEASVRGFQGAKYKSFPTRQMAEKALREDWQKYWSKNVEAATDISVFNVNTLNPKVEKESICVDAACSGNPGKMEYRGVDLKTGIELFRQGPYPNGTNNIGEFLAIVHALALVKNYEIPLAIYSDSKIAIGWIKAKKCRTKLERNEKTKTIYNLIERAEKWLSTNSYNNPILKWQTKIWGEIPADFGRK